jgi:hypothetical protein
MYRVNTNQFAFQIEVSGQRCSAMLEFGTKTELLRYHRTLQRWSGQSSVPVREAVEFTRLAAKRWRYYSRSREAVESFTELRRALRRKSECEVAFILIARTGSPNRETPVGLAYCRRTWCHHLALDFLALHPSALSGRQRISGAGSGIIYGLVRLAAALAISRIWGEATARSAPFYEKVLELQPIRDLFIIEAREWPPSGGANPELGPALPLASRRGRVCQ